MRKLRHRQVTWPVSQRLLWVLDSNLNPGILVNVCRPKILHKILGLHEGLTICRNSARQQEAGFTTLKTKSYPRRGDERECRGSTHEEEGFCEEVSLAKSSFSTPTPLPSSKSDRWLQLPGPLRKTFGTRDTVDWDLTFVSGNLEDSRDRLWRSD